MAKTKKADAKNVSKRDNSFGIDENMDAFGEPMGKGNKRPLEEDQPQDEDYGVVNEMKRMLECFGNDITKTFTSKKRRLEQFTQMSAKNQSKKLGAIMRGQMVERRNLHDEFDKQLTGVVQQWEADLVKAKEQEDKLNTVLQQQQKLLAQTRMVMNQRLKTVKQLREKYTDAVEELDKAHSSQHGNVQADLQKEMEMLQKKILMDTQQQEMLNMKKNLQTMLLQ